LPRVTGVMRQRGRYRFPRTDVVKCMQGVTGDPQS
jgi:hypothetical protein